MKVNEHHHRTLFKSISWFIVGFLVAFGVLVFFTGEITMSLRDALFIQVIKFVFFYAHERVWNRSSFGQEVKHDKVDTVDCL